MAGLLNDIELEVLQRHTADLTQAIATNPSLFGQQLVQCGFSAPGTVDGIVNTLGISEYQKGSKLLSLVTSKISTAGTRENARKYFNDFLMIIAGPKAMGRCELAESLVTTFKSKDPSYKPPWTEPEEGQHPSPRNGGRTPISSGGGHRYYEKDHAEIYQKLSSHAHKWREIGRGLGFSNNEMDNIEHTPMLHLRGPMGYLEKLLSQWLQWAPGDGRGSKGFATRESLIAGLLKVNLGGLAEKFNKPTTPSPPSPPPNMEQQVGTPLKEPRACNGNAQPSKSEAGREGTDSGVNKPATPSPPPPPPPVEQEEEEPRYDHDDMKKVRDDKQPGEHEQADANFVKEAVILIHTVKKEELAAVYAFLKPPQTDLSRAVTYRLNDRVELVFGTFGGHSAAVVQTSTGSDCDDQIRSAIDLLPNVQVIIAVGFGYGRKDKCALGDVLVSTSTLAVSNIRAENDEIMFDEKFTSIEKLSPRTRSTFVTELRQMKFYCNEKEDRESKVHCGLIISGPILWNDKKFLQKLIAKHKRFTGGEMEGQELVKLAYNLRHKEGRIVDYIIIKGVADFGDGSKTKQWQYTAAYAAAQYADFKLRSTKNKVYKLPRTPLLPYVFICAFVVAIISAFASYWSLW